jgi:transposase
VLLRLITHFDREIDALAKEIDRLAKHDPRVEVLTQVRGIGRYIAMLIVAEVGEVKRFPSARHLCAWAGTHSDSQELRRQGPAGRSSKPPNTPSGAVDRCASASNGSQNAADAKSPSRARC